MYVYAGTRFWTPPPKILAGQWGTLKIYTCPADGPDSPIVFGMMAHVTLYAKDIDALLTPSARRIFKKHATPQQVQDYLDALPINFEPDGTDTCWGPLEVLKRGKAHCIEGAMLGAAILAYHGHEPLLMDIQTTNDDDDHVVALFTENGKWGALSKTNHSILRFRDAVYATPRELALSYFHEYFVEDGFKTMRAYSKPFRLRRYPLEKWFESSDLLWLAGELDDSPHVSILANGQWRRLRRTSKIERRSLVPVEWKKKGQGAVRVDGKRK